VVFEQFDLSLMGTTIKYVAEELSLPESQLSSRLSAVHLGALPALLLAPLADRLGRRRVFLAMLVGASLATLATAFAQTAWQFVAIQMVARSFVVTGTLISVVIAAEELPAAHRGLGVGLVSVLGGSGHALGAGAFAAIEVLPGGWRALYAMGALPLLALPFLVAQLKETKRYEAAADARVALGGFLAEWSADYLRLVRAYPGRCASIAITSFVYGCGVTGALTFTGFHVLTLRGWEPSDYALLITSAGVFTIFGQLIGGPLGDRFGRRIPGAICMLLLPASVWGFYLGPNGWPLVVSWVLMIIFFNAGMLVLRILSVELFPTALRATATGIVSFVQTLGWAIGLFALGVFIEGPGDHTHVVAYASFITLASAALLALFPETAARELEEISSPAPVG
jgi:putative MFS transporter